MPLNSYNINTTHQDFQMRYVYNFVLSQEAQKLPAVKSKSAYEKSDLLTKVV